MTSQQTLPNLILPSQGIGSEALSGLAAAASSSAFPGFVLPSPTFEEEHARTVALQKWQAEQGNETKSLLKEQHAADPCHESAARS